VQPAELQPGDVVSPTFNPDMEIVFECWHLARIAEALPCGWASAWPPDHLVAVVHGARYRPGRGEGEPVQLTITRGEAVCLHLRDGKQVDR
jgi:hypothetical protein